MYKYKIICCDIISSNYLLNSHFRWQNDTTHSQRTQQDLSSSTMPPLSTTALSSDSRSNLYQICEYCKNALWRLRLRRHAFGHGEYCQRGRNGIVVCKYCPQIQYKLQSLSAIMLLQNDCMASMIITHEVFHSLGLNHEQQRADRDNWITVHVDVGMIMIHCILC